MKVVQSFLVLERREKNKIMNWLVILILILISYLVGSIPIGLIVGYIIFHQDIRKLGSGNIGATNIYRNWGKLASLLVISGDIFKGAFGVFVVKYFYSGIINNSIIYNLVLILVGIAAILGSTYSIYIRFSGGKGVGCATGVLLVMMPKIVLILLLVFIIVLLFTRYVSAGSITISILFPILVFIFHPQNIPFLIFGLIAPILVIYKHRGNVQRILKGTERKLW